ncbi:MAG: hypothetical protein D6744_17860 [Planctomycetota bacterium]|nr:MAG: hypothetical protein D6744_17860 [Planctomycetota bacterium]
MVASAAILFAAVIFVRPAHAQADPNTLPRVVNAVHCEPHTASAFYWNALRDLVASADSHQLRLSIQFAPQWVDFVVADPNRVATVRQWEGAGHEIGGHHHSITHDISWDGYSSDPNAVFSSRDPGYLGDMAAYIAAVNAIAAPGETVRVVSAKDDDFPPDTPYQTGGDYDPTPENGLTQPTIKVLNGQAVWSVGLGPLVRGSRNNVPVFRNLYLSANADDVLGAAFHANDWADNQAAIESWFAFLASQDPTGARSVTAGMLFGGLLIPGDADADQDVDLSDLALLLSAFGNCEPDAGYDAGADFNHDGCVDLTDLAQLLSNFGLMLAGS